MTRAPLQVLEIALELMGLAIEKVGPGQWTKATPCLEWNVSELVNHNVRNVLFATSLFDGSDGPNPMIVSGPLAVDGSDSSKPARLFRDASTGLFKAVKDSGPDRLVDTSFGRMKGDEFLLFPSTDLVIHACDLAKATGNRWEIDEGVAGICSRTRLLFMDHARQTSKIQGDFGPIVELPPDASIQDRLLELSGRQP